MYRIEVAAGEETVFRTIEELAIGIRNGVVTPRARIYHHASQKWLPIGLHPHYKKALEMKAHPPSQPLPVANHSEPKRAPEPKPAPEPRLAPEQRPGPKAAGAPKIPAPVQSPVIAMQNEVLRDLPVISIPEPLPWTVRAPQPVEPPVRLHAPVVDAPAPHAPATHAPAKLAPATLAPRAQTLVSHAPASHVSTVRASPVHAPVSYAPLEFALPVEERRVADEEDLLLPRPTARRSRRVGGRPLMLLGAAAALVVGTHLVLTATPSAPANSSAAAASTVSEEAPESASELPPSEAGQPDAGTSSAESRAAEAPRVTIAPARVPMTPGPAFAGSVPTRPGADSAVAPRASTPAPTPAPVDPAIAPAPAAIELTLPDLPADSVVPTARRGDTMGMKKILRALNSAKPAEVTTAP